MFHGEQKQGSMNTLQSQNAEHARKANLAFWWWWITKSNSIQIEL